MTMLNVSPLSRASSLPQVIVGVHESCVQHNSIVGASLLAIAVGQSMKVLNVSPPSRAGSLLQVILGVHESCAQHNSIVGASLLAIAVGQSMKMLAVSPPSRASSLPQVILGVHESCVQHSPIVGASLLAIAVGQSMKVLAVSPPSRAIPHRFTPVICRPFKPKDQSLRECLHSIRCSHSRRLWSFVCRVFHLLLVISPPESWSKNSGIG
ncbi:hypothetical protein AB7M32_004877 [Pseudomonas sp. R151218B TE3479]